MDHPETWASLDLAITDHFVSWTSHGLSTTDHPETWASLGLSTPSCDLALELLPEELGAIGQRMYKVPRELSSSHSGNLHLFVIGDNGSMAATSSDPLCPSESGHVDDQVRLGRGGMARRGVAW